MRPPTWMHTFSVVLTFAGTLTAAEYEWGRVNGFEGHNYIIYATTNGANPAGQLLRQASVGPVTEIGVIDASTGGRVNSIEKCLEILGVYNDFLWLKQTDYLSNENKAVRVGEYGSGGGVFVNDFNNFWFRLPYAPTQNDQSNIVLNGVSGLANSTVRRRIWKEVFYHAFLQRLLQEAADDLDTYQSGSPLYANRIAYWDQLGAKRAGLLSDIASGVGIVSDVAEFLGEGRANFIVASITNLDQGWISIADLQELVRQKQMLAGATDTKEFLGDLSTAVASISLGTSIATDVWNGMLNHAVAQGNAGLRVAALEQVLIYANQHGLLHDTELLNGFYDAKNEYVNDKNSMTASILGEVAGNTLSQYSTYSFLLGRALDVATHIHGISHWAKSVAGKMSGPGWFGLGIVTQMTFDAADEYDLIRHGSTGLMLQEYLRDALSEYVGNLLTSCDAGEVDAARTVHSCMYFCGYYYFDNLKRVGEGKWYNPLDWVQVLLGWFSDLGSVSELAASGAPRNLDKYRAFSFPYYSLTGETEWLKGLLRNGMGPQISVAPSSLEFGSVPLGAQATRTLTIDNASDSAADLIVTSWLAGDPAFTLSPANPIGSGGDVTIAPGSQIQVLVTFAPQQIVSYNTPIAIASNDVGGPVCLQARGVGGTNGSGIVLAANPNPGTYNSPVQVTATVRDAYGNLVGSGQHVEFSAGLFTGFWSPSATVTTNAQGQATATWTPKATGPATIDATHLESGVSASPPLSIQVNSATLQFTVLQFAGDASNVNYHYDIEVKDLAGNPVTNAPVTWSLSHGSVLGGSDTRTNSLGVATLMLSVAECRPLTVTTTVMGQSYSSTHPAGPCPVQMWPAGHRIPAGGACMDLNAAGSKVALGSGRSVSVVDLNTEAVVSATWDTVLKGNVRTVSFNPAGDKIGLGCEYRQRGMVTVGNPLSGVFPVTDSVLQIDWGISSAWVNNYFLMGHERDTTKIMQFSLYDTSASLLHRISVTAPDTQAQISDIAVRPGVSTQFAAISDAGESTSKNYVFYGYVSGSQIGTYNYFLTTIQNRGLAWSADGSKLVVGSTTWWHQLLVYNASALSSGTPTPTSMSLDHGGDHIAFTSDGLYMAVAEQGGSTVSIYAVSGAPTSWAIAFRTTLNEGCIGLKWIPGTHRLIAGGSSSLQLVNLDDSTPPQITIDSPSNGQNACGQILLSGRATDAAGIESGSAQYRVNGGAWSALPLDSNNAFSQTLSLGTGESTIEVQVKDRTGWIGMKPVTVTCPPDQCPPEIASISLIPVGCIRPGTPISIQASIADAGSGVKDGTAMAQVKAADDTVIASVNLTASGTTFTGTWNGAGPSGAYHVDILACDNAPTANCGSSRAPGNVVINDPPSLSVLAPATNANVFLGTEYTVTWSLTDLESDTLVSVYLDADHDSSSGLLPVPGGIGLPPSTASFSVAASGLPVGEYYVYITASDGCGTQAQWSAGRLRIAADCNGNGVPDDQDVASATSDDCDQDGVPDECEGDQDSDGVPDSCDLCANTVDGATVDATGCPGHIPGDYDRDGDVDQQDLGRFQACAAGPAVPVGGSCQELRLDDDEDMDAVDFAVFQRCWTGENRPGNAECASAVLANQRPFKPSLVSPPNNAANVPLNPSYDTSAFSDPDGDTHAATQWQFDPTGTFASPWNGESDFELTHLGPGVYGNLQSDTQYYWRVRYLDSRGAWSEWSEAGTFRTISGPLSWSQVPKTGDWPQARYLPGLAFDSNEGVTILFGGYGTQALSDTWKFNGNAWMSVPATGMVGRWGHAMAYDSARKKTVLFGGRTPGGLVADTWEFDGSTWVSVPAAGPSARDGHVMAYDSARNRTVLFGGYLGGYSRETWEWDGSSWSLRANDGPPGSYVNSMAYDAAHGVTVLFGGWMGAADIGETWLWNGSTWTRAATTGPEARDGASMAYESNRAKVLLYGGYNSTTNQYYGDAWEWDGASWSPVAAPGPSSRHYFAMAYDSNRSRIVVFGGNSSGTIFDETWECGGNN